MHIALFDQVAPVSEDEVFKVIKSGKRKKKQWKRMVNKVSLSWWAHELQFGRSGGRDTRVSSEPAVIGRAHS